MYIYVYVYQLGSQLHAKVSNIYIYIYNTNQLQKPNTNKRNIKKINAAKGYAQEQRSSLILKSLKQEHKTNK